MNNPNQNNQNQQQQGGQQTKVVSKVARTNPVKVVSSRAGRTSPVSKVVSNADLKLKARQTPGLFFRGRSLES